MKGQRQKIVSVAFYEFEDGNKRQWVLDLECGCEVWVRARNAANTKAQHSHGFKSFKPPTKAHCDGQCIPEGE